MSSFFKIRECDVISNVYTAFPNYVIVLSSAIGTGPLESIPFFVFNSTSVGLDRSFSNLQGRSVTGSYNLSGAVSFIKNSDLTNREKQSLTRLRNIYASSSFVKLENYISSSLFTQGLSVANQTINILNIPQILYGSQVKPGSFFLRTNTGQEYFDDGRGGVFSGTIHVGCMFYQHGIVYFGSKFTVGGLQNITASFSGTSQIPMNLYLCRVERGLLNFSNNTSFTSLVSGSNQISTKEPKTFITGIGLFDKDYKLVGVAKVSSPILNEESTGLLFRLKLVF